MKHLLSIAIFLGAWTLSAQVAVDMPVHFTGTENERTVEGIASPVDGTSLLSVGTWVNGSAVWAGATFLVNTFQLTTVPVTPTQPGSLLRFSAPVSVKGNLLVQVDGSPALPLKRPDGLPPVTGQIVLGMVCEVLQVGDKFILMNSASRGCPPNTVQVNDRFCIDITQAPLTGVYEAVDRCAQRGGKLCRWDEYYHACTTVGSQLQNMFDDWEWIDDTSNHVHLADEVGRTTCMSQRTSGAIDQPASSRCCYQVP